MTDTLPDQQAVQADVFRKALASSMDLDKIVSADYGGIVRKANSTGLLPIWDKYVDQAVLQEKGVV